MELPASWMKKVMQEADHQHHRIRPAEVVERDREQRREHEGGERGADAAEVLERIHHEEAAQREGELHPEDEGERLGDGEAAFGEDVAAASRRGPPPP